MMLLALLAGCGLEGGEIVQPTPTTVKPTVTSLPTPDLAALGWRIGVTEEPLDLYPYSVTARSAAPLIELLYPAPLTIINETYTTTGVLERVPSFENGDVAYITTTVYLDASGAITNTKTETITNARQLSITYRWNPDLRWADGTPLTAADSLFAYELLHEAPSTPQLAIQSELTYDYVVLDPHTTRAYLPPLRDDPNYLETVWTPLPRHHFAPDVSPDEVADTLARTPLGYGPYQLEQWLPGLQMDFIQQPAPAQPSPSHHIQVRLFPNLAAVRDDVLAGRLDIGWSEQPVPDLLPTLVQDETNNQLRLISIANPIWEHLDFNLAVVALQDIRMRHAIAYGSNRAGLAKTLYGPQAPVWDTWIAPSSWALATEVISTGVAAYPYDPARAQNLLDEMGYKDINGDGLRENPASQPFSLTLVTTRETPVRQAISEQFVSDMARIGLDIHVRELPTEQLYGPQGPLFQRTFELALFGWLRGVDPDGAVLWSCAAIPNTTNNWTGDNFTGWCIDTADQAIRTATGTLDPTIRKRAYAEHQEIMSRELPILPWFERHTTGIASNQIKGLQLDPLTPLTWNIRSWQR